MVISIEPSIYLPGVGGIQHSDTVMVTKDGLEMLTRFPIELSSLIIRSWKPLTRLEGRLVRQALALTRKRNQLDPTQRHI